MAPKTCSFNTLWMFNLYLFLLDGDIKPEHRRAGGRSPRRGPRVRRWANRHQRRAAHGSSARDEHLRSARASRKSLPLRGNQQESRVRPSRCVRHASGESTLVPKCWCIMLLGKISRILNFILKNIAAGTAVRFEPGEDKSVDLVEIAGNKYNTVNQIKIMFS